jgi:hypothetical protein
MIQNWVTLIAAVAAAIVSIIVAWRGEQTKQAVTDLAASVAPRPLFVPVPAPRPDPGGDSIAEIERWLAFLRSLFGEQTQGSTVPGTAEPGLSLGRVLQYLSVFSEIADFFATLKNAVVGVVISPAAIKTKINGRHAEVTLGVTFLD